VMTPLP